jgi:hypothetical protein
MIHLLGKDVMYYVMRMFLIVILVIDIIFAQHALIEHSLEKNAINTVGIALEMDYVILMVIVMTKLQNVQMILIQAPNVIYYALNYMIIIAKDAIEMEYVLNA